MNTTAQIIDDLTQPFPLSCLQTQWELLSDQVMGGVSSGGLTCDTVAGHAGLRMRGQVSLANDGGFLQMALDMALGGGSVDASGWTAIAFAAIGAGEEYNVHLRTDAVTRPWQSYRHSFIASQAWTEITLPFADFTPHRLDAPFDPATLRRIGIVAIGRAFEADITVRDLRFVT